MYYESKPGDGATLAFAARTRGGGGAAVGVLMRVRAGSYAGVGSGGVTFEMGGAAGDSVDMTLADGSSSNLAVSRHNTAAGSSRTLGTVTNTGVFWVWVDFPTTVLTGSLPTVYTFTESATTAVTMSGADSPGGTANDLDGAASIELTASTAGHWKIGPVYVFQGSDRPDTSAEARAIALGDALASGYTGLVFSAALDSDYTDSVGSATGTNSGGRLMPVAPPLSMMNNTVTVTRPKFTTSDTTGSPVRTDYTFDEDVTCAVQDGGGSQALANLRETGQTGFSLYFPYGYDIRHSDLLTWDSRTLACIGSPASDPMRRAYTMVPCTEQTGGGVL